MSRRKRIYLFLLTLLAALFGLLTAFVHFYPLSGMDVSFSRSVQRHHNGFVDLFMHAVSWPGSPPWSFMLVIAATAAFYFAGEKREAKYMFLTSLAGAASWSLKLLVNRPRPTKDLIIVMTNAKNQSFPSGHVLFYVTFFGMLLLIMASKTTYARWFRQLVTAVSILLIFLIPLSRIYLGAHWFTDVNGGFVAGLFVLSVLGWFYLFRTRDRELAATGRRGV